MKDRRHGGREKVGVMWQGSRVKVVREKGKKGRTGEQ